MPRQPCPFRYSDAFIGVMKFVYIQLSSMTFTKLIILIKDRCYLGKRFISGDIARVARETF